MSCVLKISCVLVLLHFVSGQKKCDEPILDRKPCGNPAAASNQDLCENVLKCCFVPFPLNAIVRCYQPGVGSSSINSNPFPRTNQFPPPFNRQRPPPLSTHWQPTSFPDVRNPPFGNYLQAGGEPGYEGSKLLQTCNPNRRWNRCGFGFIPPSRCFRMGCCFDFLFKKCYKSTYHITKLRNKCPPGFKNPPKCSDIDECQSNPCLNGGSCQNLINTFKCNCLEPTRGEICTEVCKEPPVPVDGSISDTRTGPFDIDETVTFSCNGIRELFGESSTTCTNAGTWSNDAPTCKIVCRDPPKPVDGSISDTRTEPFEVGESVTFSCNGTRMLIGPESTECTESGKWSNPDPPKCVPECPVARYVFPQVPHLDYVQYQGTLPSMTKGTICAWINIADLEGSRRFNTIASHATAANDNDIWFYTRNAGNLGLWIGDEQNILDANILEGTWTHLCGTFDSTAATPTIAAYQNGAVTESNSYDGRTVAGNGNLVFGQDQDSVGGGFEQDDSFTGTMENFMMWDRVLDDDEILNIATRCACPDDFIVAATLDQTTINGNGITETDQITCRTAP